MGSLIYILIVIGVLCILALILSLVHPIVTAKLKAKKFGISVNWKEAKSLSNFYDLNEEFLQNVGEIISKDPSVSIITLADFYRGEGDFGSLRKDFETARASGKDVSFNTIILLNLANKDINEALSNIDKTYELEIVGISENDVQVDYKTEFKIEFERSFWVTPDLKLLKEVIESRIKLALSNSDVKAEEDAANYIMENYLDQDFWRVATSGEVITQELVIK